MTVKLDRGIRAARGGDGTPSPLQVIVTIPGRSSLRISGAHMTLVDNARYEPEQILMLSSSSPVVEKALTGSVAAYVLPVRHPQQPPEQRFPYRWRNDEIGEDIVAVAEPLTLVYVPSQEGGNTTHGFRFNAPVGRYVYVAVRDGIQGVGGYIAGKPYSETFQVEPYRQALTFLGQGSLLSFSGDRLVGFLARDVGKVEVEIGRLLPNQLQHLAPQMYNFSNPAVYEDLEGKMVERFRVIRDYSSQQPGKPTYDNIDLSPYLTDRTQSRRGLFMLHIRAVREIPGRDGEAARYVPDGAQDQRLILITDIGFIVKRSKDGSRDVFAQSIRTGAPLSGVRIEMIGRNGLAVQSAVTDAGGRAQLPRPPRELEREREPIMVLAQRTKIFPSCP
jgi:uncharacterized protein YfaS (alpha-2-macroglobulin family)